MCFPVYFWAQESVKYSGENAAFFNAEELFTKAQFAAAKQEFRVFINGCSAQKRNEHDPYLVKAHYYEGMAALKLYNNDAIPLLEQFNKTYPENNFKNEIAIGVGSYHFSVRRLPECASRFCANQFVWFECRTKRRGFI
jgi:hypothetical protein